MCPYREMTVRENAVSFPVTGSHDLRYAAVICCSPFVTEVISHIRVPPDPTRFPAVSDGANDVPVTFSPGVVVRFHWKPVVGFSASLTVMTSPGFTNIVALFRDSFTTRCPTRTGVSSGDGAAVSGFTELFPIHPAAATAIRQITAMPVINMVWFMAISNPDYPTGWTRGDLSVYMTAKIFAVMTCQ